MARRLSPPLRHPIFQTAARRAQGSKRFVLSSSAPAIRPRRSLYNSAQRIIGTLSLDSEPLQATSPKSSPSTICGATRFGCGRQSGAAQSTSIARSRDQHSNSYKPTGLTMTLRSQASWPVVPNPPESNPCLPGKGKIQTGLRIIVQSDSQNPPKLGIDRLHFDYHYKLCEKAPGCGRLSR